MTTSKTEILYNHLIKENLYSVDVNQVMVLIDSSKHTAMNTMLILCEKYPTEYKYVLGSNIGHIPSKIIKVGDKDDSLYSDNYKAIEYCLNRFNICSVFQLCEYYKLNGIEKPKEKIVNELNINIKGKGVILVNGKIKDINYKEYFNNALLEYSKTYSNKVYIDIQGNNIIFLKLKTK